MRNTKYQFSFRVILGVRIWRKSTESQKKTGGGRQKELKDEKDFILDNMEELSKSVNIAHSGGNYKFIK